MVNLSMLPKVVAEENDPEILRSFLSHVLMLNEKQAIRIKSLEAEKSKADQQRLKLDDELTAFKKRMFGKSSEKRKVSDRKRSKLKKQLSLHGESLAPAPKEEELVKLPEITIDHELTPEELYGIAEDYGYPRASEWEYLTGFYDESTEIDVVVQSYKRKKHRRHKYRLKLSKGSEKEVIVTAPAPLKIMPGAKYSTALAVEVVASKYLYHLPLERIRRQMESSGLKITGRALYSLCFFIACYLEGLAEKIKQEILNCGLALHLDETPWPINNSKESDGYLWVMSNAAGAFYQFEPTRSGAIAKELVGSYAGPVVTDGYQGYSSRFKEMKQIILAFCWAHVRRKFKDIEGNYPKECEKILDLIGDLFEIEREAISYEDLRVKRQTESKMIVDKIQTWLIETKPNTRPDSGLRKAINYTMKLWKGLVLFLDDVRIPLSNNEVERTIRAPVLGRKNFHGSRTINGADMAATLYTIIESCKKVELDPKSYILMAVKKKILGQDPLTPLEYTRQIRAESVKTV